MGRFDVVLIPYDKHKNGILLEFKTSKTQEELRDKAEEALAQIKDKQYVEVFSQHKINSVLAIGLAFFGKQVELASKIINHPPRNS